jgi:acyl carrier protein
MIEPRQPASSGEEWHPQLLQLWRKYLKLDDLSVDDDFFEKGGDSLQAIDLHLDLQRLTGRQLPESILSDAPTVRELARRLALAAGERPAPLVRTGSDDV